MLECSLVLALMVIVLRTIHKEISNKFPIIKGIMIGFVIVLASAATIMWILSVKEYFIS